MKVKKNLYNNTSFYVLLKKFKLDLLYYFTPWLITNEKKFLKNLTKSLPNYLKKNEFLSL